MVNAGRRQDVLHKALVAALTAQVSLCEEVFTQDVDYRSPILTAASLDDLETQLSTRADALTDLEVVMDVQPDGDAGAVARWQVTAHRVRPIDVGLATEVAAEHLTLSGTSAATFRGNRIAAIRHDFDPSGTFRGFAD
jgi:hypothetical protein